MIKTKKDHRIGHANVHKVICDACGHGVVRHTGGLPKGWSAYVTSNAYYHACCQNCLEAVKRKHKLAHGVRDEKR